MEYDKLCKFHNHRCKHTTHMQRDLRNQYTLYSPQQEAVVVVEEEAVRKEEEVGHKEVEEVEVEYKG